MQGVVYWRKLTTTIVKQTRTPWTLSFFLFIVLGIILLVPEGTAEAAGLVPCGGRGESPCTLCHFIVGIHGIIAWFMSVMVFLALTIITAMGVLYIVSGGNEGLTKTAKGGLSSALVGILIVLFAWLIINVLMFWILPTNDDLGVQADFKITSGFQFNCSTETTANTGFDYEPTRGTTTGNSASMPCENIDTAKTRLNDGGTVCNGQGICKSCDTTAYDTEIASAATTYGVPEAMIRAVIARESSCNTSATRTEPDGRTSCGLMQVMSNDSSYSCSELKQPEYGIMEGARILKQAYTEANSLKSEYGSTVTEHEIAAAIYNAGKGQSTASADCQSSTGWPTIPKWGCPINPGTAEFNACDIRDYACDVGACI